MALSATLYTFAVHLADVDRGVYQDVEVRVARHPSETVEFMVTRLLAYCLEYEEGIAFSDGGVSSTEEPAVVVRDLTGRVTAWIEVGAPDAERVHRGSKLARRVAVYTHREPAKVLGQLAGKRIHRGEEIPVYSFDRGFVDGAVAAIERRNTVTLSVTERLLYLDLNGTGLSTPVEEHRIPV
ncbi:YaeQ family protein [Nocardia transvalensis]|uniref:YaeQ family protein n=1 Tax=Nocardia transvalensis TaxID=37333 RepID=UPI001894587A|nr:YaeQ family protein [Nocardia transvalensis]MBF6329946.1 YaeQ family protein [Nocardia transvalensis]